MRRVPLHKVPNIVPLAGILLSVLLSALSWGVGATSAIESVIFGLIGTILSVQFEILVRQEEHTSSPSCWQAISGYKSQSRAS